LKEHNQENENMRDTRNITKHELIGLHVQVMSSPDPTHVGRTGRIFDETRQTLLVSTEQGDKCFPKKDSVFRVFLGEAKADIEGNRIMFRPEDRPKKVK